METCEKESMKVEVAKKAAMLVAAPVLAVPFATWFVAVACLDFVRSRGEASDCADDNAG